MSNLTIYPTSLALRRRQADVLEREGFFDGRGHLSVRMFMDACARAAQRRGMLRSADGRTPAPLTDLDRDLAIVEATAPARDGREPRDVLGRLAGTAREEVLARLIGYVDPLADRAEAFLEAVGRQGRKGAELAGLYRAYDRALAGRARASACRVNTAILHLLRGRREGWPSCLREAEEVWFVGLRWVPPFVETAARALAAGLGREKVHLLHILDEHEQEWWGERVMAQAGALVFGGEEETREERAAFHAAETSRGIAAFLDRAEDLGALRDGFAMLDPALAEPARVHVGFSQSVGVYGEVEDLARRTAWLLRQGACRPDEICFTARNLGDYSDAITDVFPRFGIPYHFRRGIPVMSIASVKAVLNLATFSASPRRDTLCSLLESPWVDWQAELGSDGTDPAELADDIRRSGIEPEIPSADLLRGRLAAWYGEQRRRDGAARAQAAAGAFRAARGRETPPGSLPEMAGELLERCATLGMEERLRAWARDPEAGQGRGASAHLLNARGFSAVADVLRRLASAPREEPGQVQGWGRGQAVIGRCLRNLTVADPHSTDAGVWVLTPYDLAGLRFRVVMAAGLNSGSFPSAPTQSALLDDAELRDLREALGEGLPRTALADSSAQHAQENLLFLSIIAAARHGLVLSRTSRGADGQDVPASVFYTTLWRLVGWPAYGDELPPLPPDPYDRWRLEEALEVFGRHWASQAACEPHQRQPFLGESFLSSLPLPLCRAVDEARQSIALGHRPPPGPGAGGADAVAHHVHRALAMEAARERFFDALADGTEAAALPGAAPCVGHIGEERAREVAGGGEVVDFSTTALQDLCNCPYRYYLGRIMGLQEIETNELDANPADLGSIVHLAMETGFRLLLGDRAGAEAKVAGAVDAAGDLPARLPPPRFAEPGGEGWVLTDGPAPSACARPLAVLDPARLEEYQALFAAICDRLQHLNDQGHAAWRLGAHQQSQVEWQRIRASVRSLLAAQLGLTDADYRKMLDRDAKTITRGTAFVEYVFDGRRTPRHAPAAPSAEFEDPATRSRLRVHGVIDRVDLLFDDDGGRLLGLMVLDYKGNTKDQKRPRNLAEDIVAGHDCQLPVYGTAAAEAFALPGVDPVPVIAQYLLYRKDPGDGLSAMKNWWIRLDGANLKEEDARNLLGEGGDLMGAFRARLFEAMATLRSGAFTVHPDSCDYCPFPGVCRHVEPALAREGD